MYAGATHSVSSRGDIAVVLSVHSHCVGDTMVTGQDGRLSTVADRARANAHRAIAKGTRRASTLATLRIRKYVGDWLMIL